MEIWKDIPGYEGEYQVSNEGRVKSFCKSADGRLLRPGRCNRFGHLTVCLRRGNSKLVHRLVAEAFIGESPTGHDVAHLNGDASDNRVDNLAYVTRSENNRHMVYHGRRKLTVDQVRDIKRRLAENAKGVGAALAKEYGVRTSTISSIKKGKFYAHIN